MTQETMIPTATEIANEIKMMSNHKAGPFVLVEGPWDVRFFSHHMTVTIENILPCYGWERLFATISMLQSDGSGNVLGVIDLDYRQVVGTDSLPQNIVVTDAHDLEVMMFVSPAFEKVLKQKSSIQKVKKCGSDYAAGVKHIRETILRLGTLIGTVRLYSQLESKNYSFEKMKIERFIDRRTMSLSRARLVSHLRGIHTNNKSITDRLIRDAVTAVETLSICRDCSLLCCGHDLMEIMAIGLKASWGSHASREISGDKVVEFFILAYSHDTFRGTKLFQQMDDWFKSKGYAAIWCE